MTAAENHLRRLQLVRGGRPSGTEGEAGPNVPAIRRRATRGATRSVPAARPRLRSIAVASGKGGVGKSSIAANLAVACARRGRRVLLVDGDLSMANLDILLGLRPEKNLGDVVFGRASIEEILLTAQHGVRLLPSGSGVEALADLDDLRREALLHELSRLESEADLILLDTGSGIGRQTMHLARAADQILLVTTPEPTAFTDAYATLKILARGRLTSRPGLVVNMAANPEEGRETEQRIGRVAETFLKIRPAYYGHVLLDAAVGRAVRQQQPLLEAFPGSPAAACIERLADRLLSDEVPPEPAALDPRGYFLRVANGGE